MKKILLSLALVLMAGAALAVDAAPTAQAVITTKRGEVSLTLEIAATPQTRAYGLMHRDTLGAHDGMVFLFPIAEPRAFWMKNTRIPLDMLFIDTGGRIRTIIVDAEPYSLEPRATDADVATVIELAGGRAAALGIDAGDKVKLTLPQGVVVE
jgi:uncharacterized membrane protein (UPF0127 family)